MSLPFTAPEARQISSALGQIGAAAVHSLEAGISSQATVTAGVEYRGRCIEITLTISWVDAPELPATPWTFEAP